VSPHSFSAVSSASGPVFIFCAPRHVFGGTDGVGSRFHMSAPGHIFGGAEGVGSRVHVLRSRTRFRVLRSRTNFRRYRVRRVSFSCYALPNTFSAVQRASGPVSCFELSNSFPAVLRASGPFFVFCVSLLRFHRVPFSCFALPN
jgi:hypothetical protein